jgi:hypothetical protein
VRHPRAGAAVAVTLVMPTPRAKHATATKDASDLVGDLIPEPFAQGGSIPISACAMRFSAENNVAG